MNCLLEFAEFPVVFHSNIVMSESVQSTCRIFFNKCLMYWKICLFLGNNVALNSLIDNIVHLKVACSLKITYIKNSKISMAQHFLKNFRKFIENASSRNFRKFHFENFIAHQNWILPRNFLTNF